MCRPRLIAPTLFRGRRLAEQDKVFRPRGADQVGIEGGKRKSIAERQFQVAGIVDREPQPAAAGQKLGLVRSAVDRYAEAGQAA